VRSTTITSLDGGIAESVKSVPDVTATWSRMEPRMPVHEPLVPDHSEASCPDSQKVPGSVASSSQFIAAFRQNAYCRFA
jgi:hypothetical protein